MLAQMAAPNGDSYSGAVDGDVRSGAGIYRWSDGSMYEGEWLGGEPDGLGRSVSRFGNVRRGLWMHGVAIGVGVEKFAAGGSYAGEYDNVERTGKLRGYGVYEHPDGTEYSGSWLNSARAGAGVGRDAVGGWGYRGDWHNDNRHGRGCMHGDDGSGFDGDWLADAPSKGVYRYANHDSFSGTFVDGRKKGLGVYTLAHVSGTVSGMWENGGVHGWVEKIILPRCDAGTSIFRGQMRHGRPHGVGRMMYSNDSAYSGRYR